MNGTFLRAICIFISGLVLVACGQNNDDLQRYIQQVKARPAEPIPAIPPVKTFSTYVYDGESGRDPFILAVSDTAESPRNNSGGPRPDDDRAREYLERFELDTLEMVGTLAMGGSEWALVSDPDGTVHRVSQDNYLGKNHGRVVNISPTEVELLELISDGTGGWLVREASIALDEE